jgi:hypothetical protein
LDIPPSGIGLELDCSFHSLSAYCIFTEWSEPLYKLRIFRSSYVSEGIFLSFFAVILVDMFVQ